jgi:hypothetical protein
MVIQPLEHERRFLLQRTQAEAFVGGVAPHMTLEVYDVNRPVAFTRTTYLDTDDFEFLRSSGEAISRRLRVREYAASSNPDEEPVLSGICFLEFKESAGPIRSKARFAAPAEAIAEIIESGGSRPRAWAGMLRQLKTFQSILGYLREGRLKPCLTTWYRRAALSGEKGRLRVTLDEGIAFCRPLWCVSEPVRPKSVLSVGPGRVLEVKYRGEPPGWLAAQMDKLPESPAFSKFRVGMEQIRVVDRAQPLALTRPLDIPARLRKGRGIS